MAKSPLSFVCQNCGAAYNRWQGKCESCGEWNTLAEEDTTGSTSMPVSIRSKRKGRLFALETLTGKSVEAPRLPSGMAELDRVTGGGFVRGSVLLVGGDPGIGKSTLLTQATSLMFGAFIAKRFVLRLDPDVFRLVMDAIMLAAGLSMLWNAAYST